LTYPQKSIWYLEKLNPGSGIGNIAATLRVAEVLDPALMTKAVQVLIERNEVLRFRFRELDGEPVQYLAPLEPYRLDFLDFREMGQDALFAWDREQTRTPFRLVDQPLFHFALLRIDETTSGFFARIHHLISDAWSLIQIGNEVLSYYRLLKAGRPLPEGTNPSYSEFIEAEQEYLRSERFASDRAYWTELFRVPPEVATLKSRTGGRIGLEAQRKTFLVPDRLATRIRTYCTENRTSMFALFFSALCIYLNRVRDLQDITLGTPVLNRTNHREKKTLGMFISTVPLRVQIDGDQDFVAFSRTVDKEWYSVLKHQKYPYDLLLKDVREQNRDVEHLFDIALSYQNAKLTRDGSDIPQEGRWHFNERQVESLYLHINDREGDGRIILNYDYLVDLFHPREIEFVHDHLLRLLWHALDNPTRKIARLHMLSEKEMETVVQRFNRTAAEYPRDATLSALFELQASLSPEAVAVTMDGESLTYRELNRRANRLAHRLRQLGVEPECIVALLMPRSIEMVVAILGVVKSGGAYLPIDPDTPPDRVRYLLEDSGAMALVAPSDWTGRLRYDGPVVDPYHMPAQGPEADQNPVPVNEPGDLLYVIYTSGSTGLPKGAMIEHRNVVRLLFNDRFPFSFGPEDCWTLFHSYAFDFSVWEMYGALLYGGRLVVVPKDVARDPGRFLDLLVRNRVTVLNQTPGAFAHLADAACRTGRPDLALRYVIFGGETLKPVLLRPFHTLYPLTRLVNMYGITETTVHVTYRDIDDEDIARDSRNIGKPIPTLRVHILDRNLNPLPIGIPGELCVGGDGVCRGYLNRDDLTAAKFVPDPFHPGGVLYRSGDLARFYPQGDIEYLGRIDTQVKIRGHRIELGEIESGLLRHDGIGEAKVTVLESPAGSRLCAYFVPRIPIDVRELRAFLSGFLPDYMVPACYVPIEAMPLNGNGKIDAARLPDPDGILVSAADPMPPETELQSSLLRIWRDVLGNSHIGIDDDFFQSGGDSLNAITILAMLDGRATFADLYRNPTVRTLSEAMEARRAADTQGDSASEESLLIRLSRQAKPAPLHLVCFPYGGGNGTLFKDLADAVTQTSDHCDVYAVNLPGRDIGRPEALQSGSEVARRLAREIADRIQGELVLYGHCVGSALALETARCLREEGVRVRTVFVGGVLPPRSGKRLGKNHDPWRWVPDGALVRFLEWIGLSGLCIRKEYLGGMVRAFRHDVRHYYRFFREQEARGMDQLDIPVQCIVGERDPLTRRYHRQHRRWARYGRLTGVTVISGARHYFVKTHARTLALVLTHLG